MYQLNYHSVSKPGLKLEELDSILEEANTTNSARNITGCLIYHNKSFVQILEGRKKDVLEVYGKIKTDNRHHTVTLIWENQVENRFFAEWHMAYYRPDDRNVEQFVNNLLLLSHFSDTRSGTLLSFWASVRKLLGGSSLSEYENV